MRRVNLILTALILFFVFAPDANAFLKHSKKHNPKQTKQVQSADPSINSSQPLTAMVAYLELEGDSVEYDQELNVYTTLGMAVAQIVDQNAQLEADQIIYFGKDQHVEATGNVKITRDKVVTTGESFTFDATSSKYLLTNPKTILEGAVIVAREVSSEPNNDIEYKKGTLTLDDPLRIAQGFGAKKHPRTFYSKRTSKKAKAKPTWADMPQKQRYTVTAQKIVYDAHKVRENLTVYGAKLHFKYFTLPATPKFTTTVTSDPDVRDASLLSPTLGTQGALGGFAFGPRFNFNVTDYHIVSVSPFAQLGAGGPGFGGKVGFYGPSTTFEAAYGSLKSRAAGVLKQQLFRPGTQFRVAHNQYLDDGFLGSTLARTNVEIVDRRRFKFPLTESGINLRTSTGWSESNLNILPSRYKNKLEDAVGNSKNLKTSAFKAEEQVSLISKPIFKLGTEKFNTALRLRTRNALRGYSTGDFQGIFTGGPILDNTVGPLAFEIGYDQGYVAGKSPLIYDQYIQGMQSLSLDGDLRIFEGLTLGGYSTYNIAKGELVEKQMRAKVGPKDFKMLINWDALRKQTQFGLNFLFGQPVDFEKFLILSSQNKTSKM